MSGKGLPPGERGRYSDSYVSWTPKKDLRLHAAIIQECVCSGLSPTAIAAKYLMSHAFVHKVFRKYKSVEGDRDTVLVIMSKV